MKFFTPLGVSALMRQSGTFFEAELFTNEQQKLFAKVGRGFVRLGDHNRTTKAKLFWDRLPESVTTVSVLGDLVYRQFINNDRKVKVV